MKRTLNDLTGRRFGKLVVIARGEDWRKGRVRWICRCDCDPGRDRLVFADSLASGSTRSCGCLRTRLRAMNLSGLVFGNLRVVERGADGYRGRARWVCICEACGQKALATGENLRSGKSKSCGCSQSKMGERNSNWRGGKGSYPNGYAWRRIGRKPTLEHRVVMEKIIGRELRHDENVHHINGDRGDNRPENLELWTSRQQPSRQRVRDLILEAKRILSIYEPSALGINRKGRKKGPLPAKSLDSFAED